MSLLQCCCGACSSSHSFSVGVKHCDGSTWRSAPVSITGPGGFSASGSTPASGIVTTFNTTWTALGTYTVTAAGQTVTVNVTTCANVTVTICQAGADLTVNLTAGSCSGGSIPSSWGHQVLEGGSAVATGWGHLGCLPAATTPTAAVLHATSSSPRWDPRADINISLIPCSANAATAPAYDVGASYDCSAVDCVDPVSRTLFLTDSYLGISCTLTNSSTPGTTGVWEGLTSYDYPGCVNALSGTNCPASLGIQVRYRYSGGTLNVYTNGGCGSCPSGTISGGLGTNVATFTMAATSCPPSFSMSGTTTLTCSDRSPYAACIPSGTVLSGGITVTE